MFRFMIHVASVMALVWVAFLAAHWANFAIQVGALFSVLFFNFFKRYAICICCRASSWSGDKCQARAPAARACESRPLSLSTSRAAFRITR